MPVSARLGKLFATMLALGSLTGCTTIWPSTIAAVEQLNAASFDAAGLRLAIVTQTTFRPDAGQPEFTLSVGSTQGGIETRSVTFTEVASAQAQGLQAEVRTGSELRVFALSAADAVALQRQIGIVTATVPTGEREVSLAVGISGCVVDPAVRLPVTIYVRLAPNEPYRVLVRSPDMSAISGIGGTIRPCA